MSVFAQTFVDQPDLAALSPAALRVLATAAAMFVERGAAATSVRDLTRACGLTPGALYNHFASKDVLLDTIVQHGHLRMQRRVEASLAAAAPDPFAQLAAFVHAYVGGHLDEPDLAQVVRREYLHLSPQRHRAVVTQRRRFRRVLESVLSQGVTAGAFALAGGPGAVTGQAVMILDMCSRTAEWFVPGRPGDADELIARYVEVVARMVTPVQG